MSRQHPIRTNRADSFKIYDFLRENRDRFQKDRPTCIEVAKELKLKHGIIVSHKAIEKIRRESGIMWEARRGGNMLKKSASAKLIREATYQHTLLLIRLCENLGVEIPDELRKVKEAFESLSE